MPLASPSALGPLLGPLGRFLALLRVPGCSWVFLRARWLLMRAHARSCMLLDAFWRLWALPGAPGRRRGFSREPLGRSSRPRGLQNGPRRPQDAQRSPKDAQDGLKTAQEALKTAQ